MDNCTCTTTSWQQSLIENIPSILMVILAGGGAGFIYKFRDKLKNIFCKKQQTEMNNV